MLVVTDGIDIQYALFFSIGCASRDFLYPTAIKMMSINKRVALLTQYYPPETGAASNRMRFFSDVLSKQFGAMSVFTAFPNYPDPAQYDNSKNGYTGLWHHEVVGEINIYRSRIYPVTSGGIVPRAINFLSLPFMMMRWMRQLAKHDVFVVTSGPMFTGIPVFLLSYFKKTSIILDVRDIWPERLWDTGASNPPKVIKWMLKRYELWMYSRCSSILTTTPSMIKQLDERTDTTVRLFLVRNTNQIERSHKNARQKNTSNGKPLTIVEAGTQGIVQSPETLCRAVVSLNNKYPGCLNLKFAGTGVKVIDIQRYTTKYEFISHAGNLSLDELDDFLLNADIGVHVLMDTKHNQIVVPRRLFDYAQYNLAIIFSGLGDGVEIIREANAGLTTTPQNEDELAEVIESLYLDDKKLEFFKRNSKNLTVGVLSKEHAAQQLIESLQHTLGQ